MLTPRFTTGDVVTYDVDFMGRAKAGVIIDGPYQEGAWWEYEMSDGTFVRDGEISGLVGRRPDVETRLDAGL